MLGVELVSSVCPGRAGVLFDLDDTLVDHASAVEGALSEFHSIHGGGFDIDYDGFRRSWKAASERHWERFASGEIGWMQQGRLRIRQSTGWNDLDDDRADAYFAEYVEAYESRWRLYPDVLPCLESLRGIPLGLVTNGDPSQQRRKLLRTGLGGFFDGLFVSGEMGVSKPSPRIFHEASRRLGCLPGDCVMVGDSWEKDVQGASGAGMLGVWLDRVGRGARTGSPVISGLGELVPLLAG